MPDTAPLAIDLLLEARWIIPIVPAGVVLERHAVAIRQGRIVGILPINDARELYQAGETVDLGEHVLIPGLINAHSHAAMNLLRGLADDLPLMTWLHEHIWPAEKRLMSREFVRDGTLLACAEMLRGGVTCFNDMYFFPQAAAEAALRTGMRAALGITVMEFPNAYASDPDDYLAKGLAVRDELHDQPLLSFSLAPHAPYTVADQTFERILTLAEQLELPINIHLHETATEITDSLRQYKVRPIERLHRLGLLGPNLTAIHAVHLSAEDINLLAEYGCHVAHCPTSNLKLASGIAPVTELLKRNINVCLGTDGAASNNRLDMFAEMRLAALLGKGQSGQAEAINAHTALHMATLAGAQALGLEGEVGSIEKGKAADLCAVRFDALELAPCFDPASHLVYVAGREHVSDVWVAGKRCVNTNKTTNLQANDLIGIAKVWQNKVRD